MKIVSITGTTSGIGKAISDNADAQRYTVRGLNRGESSGFPSPTFMSAVVNSIHLLDTDVFVNNAYGAGEAYQLGDDPNPQLSLFMSVLELWKSDPTKTIINIGSMAAYYAPNAISQDNGVEWHRRYRRNKETLLRASEQATLDTKNVRCRVTTISPGHVLTPRTAGGRHSDIPKMLPGEFAKYVWWVIDQPMVIRIPHLSLFAVDLNGRGP